MYAASISPKPPSLIPKKHPDCRKHPEREAVVIRQLTYDFDTPVSQDRAFCPIRSGGGAGRSGTIFLHMGFIQSLGKGTDLVTFYLKSSLTRYVLARVKKQDPTHRVRTQVGRSVEGCMFNLQRRSHPLSRCTFAYVYSHGAARKWPS